MKRLIIAAVVLVTTTGMSVWAQAPAAADADKVPQQAAPAQRPMPMTNCPGGSGAMGDAQKGCPMAPNDMKIRAGRNAHAPNDAWDDARQHASG